MGGLVTVYGISKQSGERFGVEYYSSKIMVLSSQCSITQDSSAGKHYRVAVYRLCRKKLPQGLSDKKYYLLFKKDTKLSYDLFYGWTLLEATYGHYGRGCPKNKNTLLRIIYRHAALLL